MSQIVYFQSTGLWQPEGVPFFFGYLLNGEVGRHYSISSTGRVFISPVGAGDIEDGYQVIDRPAFDRLLARWVLPPALD